MLNNKGYTLVELLATVIILGIVMAVIIPNISGISTQNKITAYAEDAKKFKNTVEYMLRGDSTVVKPQKNGECVIVALSYVKGNEFDNPPNGGEYNDYESFVVMVKKNNKYEYYVQLSENVPGDGGDYTGYSLLDYTQLEGNEYLNNLSVGFDYFVDGVWTDWGHLTSVELEGFLDCSIPFSGKSVKEITGCNTLLKIYG